MGRVQRFFASWGLDVLVVCAAAATAVGTTLRTDPDRPDGVRLALEATVVSLALLILLARRQFPFLAPALVWIACPALSLLDGNLIGSQAGVVVCGLGAAVLLGSLRNGMQQGVGLLVVLVGSTVVVYDDPVHVAGDFLFTPILFSVGWLVGYALGERADQADAAEERALRAE